MNKRAIDISPQYSFTAATQLELCLQVARAALSRSVAKAHAESPAEKKSTDPADADSKDLLDGHPAERQTATAQEAAGLPTPAVHPPAVGVIEAAVGSVGDKSAVYDAAVAGVALPKAAIKPAVKPAGKGRVVTKWVQSPHMPWLEWPQDAAERRLSFGATCVVFR